MKCTACNGRGYIEIYHGLVIRKCPECKGLGEIDLEDYMQGVVYGKTEEDTNVAVDAGIEQAAKPVRSPHTRKSTRSRKRQKVK